MRQHALRQPLRQGAVGRAEAPPLPRPRPHQEAPRPLPRRAHKRPRLHLRHLDRRLPEEAEQGRGHRGGVHHPPALHRHLPEVRLHAAAQQRPLRLLRAGRAGGALLPADLRPRHAQGLQRRRVRARLHQQRLRGGGEEGGGGAGAGGVGPAVHRGARGHGAREDAAAGEAAEVGLLPLPDPGPPAEAVAAVVARPHPLREPRRHLRRLLHLLRVGVRGRAVPQPGPG
mmetsp:Transcript_88500/g.235513  ORF Transcript_88500/g.235513 Transcript_88500/m.235513 type:complete len:228 (-) Transcript_88500:1218-1901(-)